MNGIDFIRVYEEPDENPIEIPIEEDGTVLLTTLNSVFPRATGLKHLSVESHCFRGVRLIDKKLYPPPEGWIHVYYCAFPKGTKLFSKITPDNKRKSVDEEDEINHKSKKVEEKKCTDLIVLNLPWKTDELTLKNYFSKYGDLLTVQIKRHPGTQQSKGYGFIRFSDYEPQVLCLAERHNIDGRWCDVRIPMSKMEGDRQDVSRKVHVGGINESITTDVLREYFSRFGTVIDVFIPKPFRSFAFVSFEDPEVAADLFGKEKIIDGVTVTIGSAVPRFSSQPWRNNNSAMYSNIQYPWGWPYPNLGNESTMHNLNTNLYSQNGSITDYNLLANYGSQYMNQHFQPNGSRVHM